MPPRKEETTTTPNDDIKRLLLLEGSRKTFLAEHIRALIRIYGLRGIKADGSDGLLYDILFRDNITTDHFAQFQWMWHNRFSGVQEHKEWWKTFQGFIVDCFNKTRTQTNKYFQDSHPEEPVDRKWFPRPAKMHPPRPDEDAPPLTVTVNRKRISIGTFGAADERHAKRARTREAERSPGTSKEADQFSDWDHHNPPPPVGATAPETPPRSELGVPTEPAPSHIPAPPTTPPAPTPPPAPTDPGPPAPTAPPVSSPNPAPSTPPAPPTRTPARGPRPTWKNRWVAQAPETGESSSTGEAREVALKRPRRSKRVTSTTKSQESESQEQEGLRMTQFYQAFSRELDDLDVSDEHGAASLREM
jgi:hypothetical protein